MIKRFKAERDKALTQNTITEIINEFLFYPLTSATFRNIEQRIQNKLNKIVKVSNIEGNSIEITIDNYKYNVKHRN